MNLLMLGGTGEARKLARQLIDWLQGRHRLIYSVAGLGLQPDLGCEVRSGGFGGVVGLGEFLKQEAIDLVLDLTHPYAVQISRHAVGACNEASVPLWRYHRAPWLPGPEDRWREVSNWQDLLSALACFDHAMLTVGSQAFNHVVDKPEHQKWTVRCLPEAALPPGMSLSNKVCRLDARGPFLLDQERALIRQSACDVLVSKNSGGQAAFAKLQACRELRIPVLMLARPEVADADWVTGELVEMMTKVKKYLL